MRIPFGLILTLALGSTLHAQLPDGVHAGMRVRVTTRSSAGLAVHTGTILQVRGDSVVLRESESEPLFMFASRDIAAVDVSGGRPFSTWSAVKFSATVGALIGGVIGYKHYDVTDCYPPTTACRNGDIVVGGLQGAAIGIGAGLLAGRLVSERWTPAGAMQQSAPPAPSTAAKSSP